MMAAQMIPAPSAHTQFGARTTSLSHVDAWGVIHSG
jgi:hypothetical protein